MNIHESEILNQKMIEDLRESFKYPIIQVVDKDAEALNNIAMQLERIADVLEKQNTDEIKLDTESLAKNPSATNRDTREEGL